MPEPDTANRARSGLLARVTGSFGRIEAEASANRRESEHADLADRFQELEEEREDAVREARLRAVDYESRLAVLGSLALTDELTRLPNRRALDHELPRELARAVRHQHQVCAVLLDVDHFKEFNDEKGHRAGDVLLTALAAAWRAQLRASDFVARGELIARYGGEEFVVVLPECDEQEAMAVVERLRAVVPSGQTCSAGIARWNGVETAGDLLHRADQALYRAKRSGRDRAFLASTSEQVQLGSRNGNRASQ